jgi:hypothetical protein
MAYDEAAGPSGSAKLTEATATTGASHHANGVMFNNKQYSNIYAWPWAGTQRGPFAKRAVMNCRRAMQRNTVYHINYGISDYIRLYDVVCNVRV